jgi:energy-coupling factor transporter ATP-binding protein EcfA2
MSATKSSPKPQSPLHEILTWSANRPEWQRDALRRIIEKGALDSADISELERISRSSITIASIKPSPILAKPLTSGHIPSASGGGDSVHLESLKAIKNVNQLPHSSELTFGIGVGLTIIFGRNGAGKSSYARLIKKACRARGSAPNIMPNAFASTIPSAPASATITFSVGTASIPAPWTNGQPSDARLANVFVFDSFSAEHYVSTDSAAAFTPFGLDVLPTLSKACDELAARLTADVALANTKITGTSANWKYDPGTKVGQLLQGLSKTTKVSDINALAGLSAAEVQRLTDLRDTLKADPIQKAKETRAAVARLDSFATKISSRVADLAADKVEQIRAQLDTAANTSATAKAFASGQFDSTYLPGTGSAVWRVLWDAAKSYSETQAYPGQEYPPISDDARCVLCQQEIDSVGKGRFSRFGAFCKDKTQQLASEAEQTLLQTVSRFKLLNALGSDLDKIDADLALQPADERSHLATFVLQSDETLQTIKTALADRKWTVTAAVPASPESSIRGVADILEARAKTEESAHDPVTRQSLQSESKELEAQDWLNGVQTDVIQQIDRYKALSELEHCEKDLKTSAVTTKSKELTELFVTQAFQQRFKDEVAELKLNTIDVVMEAVQGKKGVTNFGLRLVKATNSKVADIASEGERRCVALAAFLSELSQASHQSALVFDDPVSSLDHWYRERIAERLVKEAKVRQVIVFTHDEVFLNDLICFSENTNVTPCVLSLEWENGAPGKCIQGLPWDSKKPLQLLAELETEQKGIANQWNPQPNQQNIATMRHAYSRLRSTMERIVEIELIGGIVCRFQSQVISGRVDSLIGITQHECSEVKRLLDKCHSLTEAHAPSLAAIPTPTELLKDISDARQLVATIKSRKKTSGSAGTP